MIRGKSSAFTFALFSGLLLIAAGAWAADGLDAERLSAGLVERGFENVGVSESGDTISVWYENRIYRREMAALGLVAFSIASSVAPGTVVEIIPQNYRVPLIAVSASAADWLGFLRGEQPSVWFRDRVTVHPGEAAPSIRDERPSLRHSSFWRTDLRLRPLFDFELGLSDDPFRSAFLIAPEAIMTPLPGALLTLQVKIEVDNDLPGHERIPRVRPGRNTVSWGGWLPGRWLCALSGGIFPHDRYGFVGQIGSLRPSGTFEITAGGDLTGYLEFTSDRTLYSAMEVWSAYLAITHRTPKLDIETTVTGARFMEEEWGVRVDLARRFGEAELGFFGINTQGDKVVGVDLRVPLPVRKWSSPSRVRFTTVPDFPFEYRDSLADVGLQVSQYDDLDRLRKRLYPTYILNNLEVLRDAIP